jgi:hypothetical protein
MKKGTSLIYLVIFLLIISNSFSQSREIRGKVTNQSDNLISEVEIKLKD